MSRNSDYTKRVDLFIGDKIRELRVSLGLTGQELALKIDVSNQQLQKYELGINRVAVSRLLLISKALGRPVSYFIDGIEGVGYESLEGSHRLNLQVARNFAKITNPAQRKVVNALISSLVK